MASRWVAGAVLGRALVAAALGTGCGAEPSAPPTRLGEGGEHVWSLRLGADLGQSGPAVALGSSGAIATTGFFRDHTDLGGGELHSAGKFDAFVCLRAADGAHLWSRRCGGEGDERGVAVAIGPSGEVVVAGVFELTAELGGDPLVSAGGDDVFVAAFSSAGAPLWSRRLGGPGTDDVAALAVGASGDLTVVGWFSGTAELGGPPLTAAGDRDGTDAFVARFDGAGQHLWSVRLGDEYSDYGTGVAVDGEGGALITARLTWPRETSGGGNDDGVRSDVLLARLDGAGAIMWERRLPGTDYAAATALAVDGQGRPTVAGAFVERLGLGDTTLMSRGNSDAFVAGYTASGELRWHRQLGDRCSDRADALAATADGEVVLAGSFECEVDLGGGPLQTQREDWDAFVGKLGAGGEHVWSQRLGGEGWDHALAVAVDEDGHAALTGEFFGPVDLGGEVFETHGRDDLFLVKLAP